MPLLNKRLLQETALKHRHEIASDRKQALKELFQDTLIRIESGKFKKEESEKVPFLQKMFEILGYKLHENLEFEYSTSFGRSIDGVLGLQTEKGRAVGPRAIVGASPTSTLQVEIAIEWKGIDTKNLDKGKAGETPVSQMWDYMGKVGAEIGIVGNFLELRIYTLKTKQADFQQYFLRELTEKEDKLDEFIFLLKRQTLLKNDNKQSFLEHLISQSELEQEQITKRFYNDYKQRRTNLFEHLVENNQDKNKHNLLEKTQKILDRLIFVMFCEDRNLLPPSIIRQTFDLGKKSRSRSETKIWEEFEYLFEDIDKGRYDINPTINAFNGGLFADDLELNNLIIKDKIWTDLVKLAEYDFGSDLDVNILGHIFEQSISDIEQIKAELEGEALEKKKSKRKKDGIYYTPEYITDYIVSETVGGWLNQESNPLEQIKILDPAGGSGAFPNQVHNYLAKKHEAKFEGISKDKNDLFNQAQTDKSILKDNIFMVDLQPESVEIAKLSLWLKTAQKDQKLNNLDQNVKCGNSLKLNWRELFGISGFDVIVGNPPYIKEYTNKSAFDDLHDNPYYQGKMDLWTMFACQAIDELADGGYLSFIAPNSWISNSGASIFRDKILTDGELKTFIDFGDFKVFEDAGIQTMVFVFKKCKPREKYAVDYARVEDKNIGLENIKLLLSSKLKAEIEGINKFEAEIQPAKLKGKNLAFVDKTVDQILEKMEAKKEFVLTDKEVSQGIVGAPDKAFIFDFKEYQEATAKEKEYLKLYYTNIGRYEFFKTESYIFYSNKKNLTEINEVDFPNISKRVLEFKEGLINRREVKSGQIKEFHLQWARNENLFVEGEKIVCAIRTEKPSFYYTESEYYGSRALNFIKTDRINLKYLTGVLNSNIVYFWLKHKGKLLGDLLQIDKAPLLNIPIPKTTTEQQTQIAELVDQIMELKKDNQTLTESLLKLIKAKYKVSQITTKLKKWHELETAEFLDEIKKLKLNLGFAEEAELINYFESEKTKVNQSQTKVNQVDGEIEGLVRGLYEI
jgi:N-6 DNA Methylase/TaqI-like C-terminal specificity domain